MSIFHEEVDFEALNLRAFGAGFNNLNLEKYLPPQVVMDLKNLLLRQVSLAYQNGRMDAGLGRPYGGLRSAGISGDSGEGADRDGAAGGGVAE